MHHSNDTYIREQALDISQSFIVQAPAGSGKTQLLSYRYLALLANVERAPEEIIAITFTKKAAAQMRSRLLAHLTLGLQESAPTQAQELIAWQLAKKVLARDKKEGWGLLENPNRLLIQTIDALCSSITRKMPYLSRFGAQPAIVDDANAYYQRAAQACLKMIDGDVSIAESLRCILQYLDNNTIIVEQLLINMLAKREQWFADIMSHHANEYPNKGALRAQLEKQLASMVTDQLIKADDLLTENVKCEWIFLARFAANQLSQTNPTHPLSCCQDLTDFPPADEKEQTYWQALLTLIFTQQGECRKRVDKTWGFPAENAGETASEKALYADMKKRMSALLTVIADNSSLLSHLQACLYAPTPSYQDKDWALLEHLLTILPVCVAQLKKIFQQEGRVDFTEITLAALQALGDEQAPTDLALALDYRISHILVDEFQDTSVSQFALLEKLISGWQPHDGRTLFLVGDPMQSIYRFRQAEVSLFLQAKSQGIADVQLTPLNLTANFRSQETVVEWNNRIFSALFPKAEEQETGAIAYHPAIAYQPAQKNSVAFHVCDNGVEEAQVVVTIVQQQLRDTTGTIAILVRARSHLKAILPALQRAGIAYQATEIEALSHQSIIQDLLSITRALLYLGDKIAWLSILRAPWCGLSLSDLDIITRTDTMVLWQRIEECVQNDELSAQGKIRLQRFHMIMQYRLAERARLSLRAWVEGTWLALGGPACLIGDVNPREAQCFWQLLDTFEREQWPLNSRTLQQAVDKLYASYDHHHNARLSIMTIHKAKGLEFDSLILPGLSQESRGDNKPLLAFSKHYREGLKKRIPVFLVAPLTRDGEKQSAIYDFLWRQERLRAEYESVRLLYVAATRAKSEIHFVARCDGLEKKPRAGSFLHLLWPWFSEQAIQHEIKNIAVENALAVDNKTTLYRLPCDWQLPDIVSQHFPEFDIHNDLPIMAYQETQEHLAFCALIQRILAHIAKEGVEKWNARSRESQERRGLELLSESAVIKEKRLLLLQQVMNIIRAVLNDSTGAWLLKTHTDAKTHYTIAWKKGHQVAQARIDRLFIDETGTRWIINYVLEQPTKEQGLAEFLEVQREQHQSSLMACARLFANATQPIKLCLYFPLITHGLVWNYSVKTATALY